MKVDKVVISKWYFASLYENAKHPYPAEKIRQNNYLYDNDSERLTIRVTR